MILIRLFGKSKKQQIIHYSSKQNVDLEQKPLQILLFWCRRRDSNSHSLSHYPLKIACLPISPRRHLAKPFNSTALHKGLTQISGTQIRKNRLFYLGTAGFAGS